MIKQERYNLADYLSKKYLKSNFKDLPTPLRILMYGEILDIIDKAQFLKRKYGKKRLEIIWNKNRVVGSKSKEYNFEVG